MWTTDGREFPAPTFQLGISPAGSMYTTVDDLGHFMSAIFADAQAEHGKLLSRESLEKMWTPQYAKPGQKTGFGIGFGISEMNGHRKIGHGGAIYGFASQLSMLPDDKLGVIVVTTKDAVNAVTSRIADAALEAMLAVREGRDVKAPESTRDIDLTTAQEIAGRYVSDSGEAFDITLNAADKLIFLRSTGGFPAEIRAASNGTLITDGKLGYGLEFTPQKNGLKFGGVVYKKTVSVKPPPAPEKWRGLIGEYGHDHDVLFIIEKDGKLHAVIEWFEYDPLEEVSRNVFNFPKGGLYGGEQVVFTRDKSGRATSVTAGGVIFERRNVGPEGTGQLRIKPVRPVAELLKEALKATPPTEKGEFLKADLVEVAKLDPSIKLDIRYSTTNNFLGSVFYSQPKAIMQRPAAEAVVRANKQLKKLGYGLLIHDAYRPWYVTKVFWDATPDDKKIFVADPSQGSRHNRGMAVDITLYDLKTGKPIEMVGTYDEISDRSYPDYPGGTSLRRWHRKLLRSAMEAEGFRVYEAEWWHFDYKGWTNYTIGNEIFENIVTESN